MKIAISSLYLPSGSKIGVGYQVHYMANELVSRTTTGRRSRKQYAEVYRAVLA